MWSTMLKKHVVVVGDLNLDRMRVNKRVKEGQGSDRPFLVSVNRDVLKNCSVNRD